MAKIQPLKIGVVSETDAQVSANRTFEMKVMSDGIFWAILPEDDVDVICQFGDLKKFIHQDRTRKMCMTGNSVDQIRDRLRPWIESLLEVDVETQTLILYHFESDCPHTKDKVGNIHRHGGENPDYDGRTGFPYGWEGKVNNGVGYGSTEAFYVRILSGIWIETKTTAKGQAPSYQYSRPKLEDLGPYGQSLVAWPGSLSNASYRGEKTTKDYVSYTEERAKFFDEVQMTMCKLQVQMNDFFTGEGIEARIAQGNFLQLGKS